MELTLATRKAITKAQVEKYRKGSKREKAAILDAICEVTNWHRDHARKAMRLVLNPPPPPPPSPPRPPRVTYDDDVIRALSICWAVLDGPTGKRLRPALPALVNRHGFFAGVIRAAARV